MFRALPLAIGLLYASGNALAVPVSTPYEYSVNQQTNQVTGVINDANGEPLIGVNVVEKGNTQNGRALKKSLEAFLKLLRLRYLQSPLYMSMNNASRGITK